MTREPINELERFDKAVRTVTNVWYPAQCRCHTTHIPLRAGLTPPFPDPWGFAPHILLESFPINRSTLTLGILFRQPFSRSQSQLHMMTSGEACQYSSSRTSPRLSTLYPEFDSVVWQGSPSRAEPREDPSLEA